MKKYMTFFLLSAMLFASVSLSFNAKTGDVQLDATLNNLNIEAKANPAEFTAELSATYKVDNKTLSLSISKDKMEPAEVYLACELANLSEKPYAEVVKVYKANKAKGWGYIAKQLGIKPGSPEFKALKSKSSNKLQKEKNKNKGKGKPAAKNEKTKGGNKGKK